MTTYHSRNARPRRVWPTAIVAAALALLVGTAPGWWPLLAESITR